MIMFVPDYRQLFLDTAAQLEVMAKVAYGFSYALDPDDAAVVRASAEQVRANIAELVQVTA